MKKMQKMAYLSREEKGWLGYVFLKSLNNDDVFVFYEK
ncbi:putative quinol monooxygenase [Niallia sp. NCCP-28]